MNSKAFKSGKYHSSKLFRKIGHISRNNLNQTYDHRTSRMVSISNMQKKRLSEARSSSFIEKVKREVREMSENATPARTTDISEFQTMYD